MTHFVVWSIILFWHSGGFMDLHTAFPTEVACQAELEKRKPWDAKDAACWPVQIGDVGYLK
jgi:hypothetical protein